MAQLQKREAELDKELERYKSNDPAALQLNRVQTMVNKTSVERWTDNIWSVKKFLTKKKNMPGKVITILIFWILNIMNMCAG